MTQKVKRAPDQGKRVKESNKDFAIIIAPIAWIVLYGTLGAALVLNLILNGGVVYL